jgi:hypothetical protein
VLGNVAYTDAQLCAIFDEPAKGNGLVSLAHQLIAAKLNILNGSGSCPALLADIAAADALIGNLVVPPVGGGSLASSSTSPLTMQLDKFNNGVYPGCPAHCGSVPSSLRELFLGEFKATSIAPGTWGSVKVRYR